MIDSDKILSNVNEGILSETDLLFQEIYQVGYLDSEEKIRLANKAKNILGDNWKEAMTENILTINSSTEKLSILRVLEKQWKGEDVSLLAKIISEPSIIQSTDRSCKSDVIESLLSISEESSNLPNEITVGNIKKAIEQIIKLIEKYEDVDNRTAELARMDLFNMIKVTVFLDPRELAHIHSLVAASKDVFTSKLANKVREFTQLFSTGNLNEAKTYYYPLDIKNHTDFDELDYYGPIDRVNREYPDDSDNSFEKTWFDSSMLESNFKLEIGVQKSKERPSQKEIISDLEAVMLARKFFEEDMQYMKQRLEEYPSEAVEFRGLIMKNPSINKETPIMIIRPNLEFDPERSYNNDGGRNDIHHHDVWYGWEIESIRNPTGERAKLFRYLADEPRKYNDLTHIYLEYKKAEDSGNSLEIVLGWPRFVSIEDPHHEEIIMEMARYGIDIVKFGSHDDEAIDVEKLILKTEINFIIERTAKQLSEIITPSEVRIYRNLAYKFLSDPNPNKGTPAYQKFFEYFTLARKL